MNYLNNIKIENWKSIRSADLDLSNLNVFIGPNGAGKSNFIEIFNFLNHIIDKRLQVYTAHAGGADNLLHFGKKHSSALELSFTFSQRSNGYNIKLAPTLEDNFYFTFEQMWFHAQYYYPEPRYYNLGEGHVESKLVEHVESPDVATHVVQDVKNWKVYHFHDTSASSKMKNSSDLEDNIFLRKDASNLASFLYRLQQTDKKHFQNIQDTIKLVAPFFERFQLLPSRLNPEKIKLEWQEKNSDKYFNASALSDGTLRFICMATLLLQPQLPSTIILDEPELGLHPFAISVLAALIKSASQQTQVILSTQSVTLLNHFSPESIIVVDRAEQQTVFKRLKSQDIQSWIDEYTLGELWEKNVIGGRP